MRGVKCWVFDVGGTLLEYAGMPLSWVDSYPETFARVNEEMGLGSGPAGMGAAVEALRRLNARVNPREEEYDARRVFAAVTRAWGVAADPYAVALCFYRQFQRRVRVLGDAPRALDRLRRAGCPLGALTDLPTGMPTELARADAAPLADRLDCLLTSVDVGWRKPRREGLDLLAARLGVDTRAMAFVGDEPKDMQAARNAGALAVLVDRHGQAPDCGEDRRVRSLDELGPSPLDGDRSA